MRNWVIYEADGSRHWVYRTPPGRSAEVAPQPGDIPSPGYSDAGPGRARRRHAAGGRADRRAVRERARGAVITLDTHETGAGRPTVLDPRRLAGVFLPSREELAGCSARRPGRAPPPS